MMTCSGQIGLLSRNGLLRASTLALYHRVYIQAFPNGYLHVVLDEVPQVFPFRIVLGAQGGLETTR